MLSRRYKLLRISLIMINLLHCFSFLSNSATSGKYISASSIITASASIHIIESSKESNDSSVPMNRPSKPVNTINTALLQYGRLVGTHNEHEVMSRTERLIRIIISWTLLLFAKSISLASPLFFKKLIEAGSLADESMKTSGSITSMIQTSALGLIIGYGSFKIAAGFVQLLSELILNPVTTFVAEILPKEAFSAALWRASKRINEGKQKETSAFESKRVKAIIARVNNLTPSRAKNISVKEVVASSSSSSSSSMNEIKGQITQACRSLDRGMKASNQFLYRSVFNLLPSFVESLCALILIFRSTSVIVGTTAIVVAFTFVAVTATIMHYRVNIMRAQIVEESKANGFAEDALLLAETVAAFGAMHIEESRYADALRSVSHTSLYMRRSFSFLKVMQAVVMGLGSGALIFAAWWSHHPDCWVGLGLKDGFTEEVRTITGTLILTQALFAQLCAPLDHVGQHFRDCVQAAEDMRELEVLKRDCNDLMVEQSTPKNIVQEQPNDLPINPSDKAITDSYTLVSNTRFSHVITDGKLKQNKYNTFPILSQFPIVSDCKLSLDNLFFAYPTIGSDSSFKHSYTLKNVSFSMPFGGYSIGIVGPSGSGKSTLVRVLLGLESIDNPKSMSSGRVIIDGRDLSPFNRVPFFSVVGQDSDLFRGLTLEDNVKYGSETLFGAEKFTAEQKDLALHRAALDAQLYPVISKLENGWKANVGPRGRLLSGGERQRTCLARALYRQELGGGMLLMDEVTASLDAQTESIVTNAIMSRVQQGASAILIAHRLSSVAQCNLILVLKDGEIIEHGTHQQLIEKVDGWYAESWVLQSQSQQSSSAVAYWE